MLAKNLFGIISYSEKAIAEYEKYSAIIGNSFDKIAESVVLKKLPFNDGFKEARRLYPEIDTKACDLMFVLECTGYLHEEYKRLGFSDYMFNSMMLDIRAKTEECYTLTGEFGTVVPEWFDYTFIMRRFAFGRLQYDILTSAEEPFTVGGHTVSTGELWLNCHIPSTGPLLLEDVISSFKSAYDFYKDKIIDGKLVIGCYSWLLFLDYKPLFERCSAHICDFIKLFKIYKVERVDRFDDGWRIFGKNPLEVPVNELKTDTSMRRVFAEYIKSTEENKNRFGEGYGVLIFDGINVLNS